MKAINEILQRKAEFEILGDARYATERQYDVMENFSRNEGVSETANAGIGLGMGLGMIGQVGPAFSRITGNTLGQQAQTESQVQAAATAQVQDQSQAPTVPLSPGKVVCARCRHENVADARFCSGCGNTLQQAPAEKKICPSCRTENDEQARFCHHCGTSIGSAVCRQCGKTQAPGAKFCNECGTSMRTE